MFGTLSPVWTRFGVHAMNPADPRGPQIVHAFVERGDQGYTIKETWDTLGMRATRSDDTILDGVFVPDDRIARIVPAGAFDPFILSMFAVGSSLFGNVYLGIAQRAFDIAVASAKKRTTITLTRSMAYHPEVQHDVAEMAIELESMIPQIERVAEEWENGVDHGHFWGPKLAAAKFRCVEGAKRVVDLAMTVYGSGSLARRNELERLYRDVRAGGIHPPNSALTHELVGKTMLGINMDEQPRWG
jgi:alkylation response protein AidB-like acyl-CoA dehydrogenase